MKQFFAYVNTNARSASEYPYLLNIQSDLVDFIDTSVMVPLHRVPSERAPSPATLSPVLTIAGEQFVMMTPLISVIEKARVGQEAHDLSTQRHAIMAALDFLISGI